MYMVLTAILQKALRNTFFKTVFEVFYELQVLVLGLYLVGGLYPGKELLAWCL